MADLVAGWTGAPVGYLRISDDDYSINAHAQIFSIDNVYNIESVKFYAKRLNVATTVTVALYGSDGTDPTGVSLGSKDLDASGWDTTASKKTFTFDAPIPLEAGNYAIVVTEGSNYSCAWAYSGTGQTGARRRIDTTWDSPFTPTRTFYFEVYAEAGAPTKPENPVPANNATEVDFSAYGLSWDDGGGADTYNVYIGKTGLLTRVASAQAETTFTTNLTQLETIFGVSPIDQKIYWRVDAINDNGTTEGDEWNFDARPAKASVPVPADTTKDITLDIASLTWTGGATASTYNMLVDTGSGLESQETGLEAASWTVDITINYITTYTWRIDSLNAFGTTTGDEWSFTTLRFSPPEVIYYDHVTGQHYQLLVDADGNFGDHPADGGVEDTDFEYLAATYSPNFMCTARKLVGAANDKIWFEDV